MNCIVFKTCILSLNVISLSEIQGRNLLILFGFLLPINTKSKFFQILLKWLFANQKIPNTFGMTICKSKYHQIPPRPPKYWDFQSFFSIWSNQMSWLAGWLYSLIICIGIFCIFLLPEQCYHLTLFVCCIEIVETYQFIISTV